MMNDAPRLQLLLGMIDSHCHLSLLSEHGFRPENIAAECLAGGMSALLDVAVTEADFEDRVARSAGIDRGQPSRRIFVSAGIYPSECEDATIGKRLDQLERILASGRADAVGETGLDNVRRYGAPEAQQRLFRAHLQLAARYDLPVIVHNRDANQEILRLIQEVGPVKGVMHCFSGDETFLSGCLATGFMISFAGNITYRSAELLRHVLRLVPDERLLIETDSPYLSPQSARGKPNFPGRIGETYRTAAEARNVSIADLVRTVRINFSNLLSPHAFPQG